MYKKLMSFTGMMLLVSCMIACNSISQQSEKKVEKKETVRLVGNDKDSHGCIGSAGYVWSELLHDCIRPFENGIKLKSTFDSQSTYAAYLVFDRQSTHVEVYLPKQKNKPILSKKAENVWGDKNNGNLSVVYVNNVWKIYRGDRELYTSTVSE